MNGVKFEGLLRELDDNSLETLLRKNARYSVENDRLHNFNAGGDIFGGTPAQACWGYMTKHLVALRDMVQKNDFSDRDDFMEKCQDVINYVRFLWCIGNEEMEKYKKIGYVLDKDDISIYETSDTWPKDNPYIKKVEHCVIEDLEECDSYLKEKENEENEDDK